MLLPRVSTDSGPYDVSGCRTPHGLYIHIPFCIRKCPYCDFYSTADISLKPLFLKALMNEMTLRSDLKSNFDTIYLGGGTPSVLAPEEVDEILTIAGSCFSLTRDIQVTMEVNPGTVNGNYLSDIRSCGVNRLNIGVQSFNDEKLGFLNRIHSASDAEKVLLEARRTGFDEIGFDLMYGLPGETQGIWMKDMERALVFSPEHLSCYMLTYESGTPMGEKLNSGAIVSLKDEIAASLFKTTASHLNSQGYLHYEISNFAISEPYRSRHNMKYWQMVPYTGLGPSAHSFNLKTRFWNHRDVSRYVQDLENGLLPVAEREVLAVEEKSVEMILLGLRTSNGIDIKAFECLSGRDFGACFSDVIDRLHTLHWCECTQSRLWLTTEGMVYLDTVVGWFVDRLL